MTHTHIYIYTTQLLRYPEEALQLFAYIHGAIWTIQQLIDTFAFKGHWPHDLHDLVKRILFVYDL